MDRKYRDDMDRKCRDTPHQFLVFRYRSTFSEFSTKYTKDDRYKAVEKLRDRETYFQDFIAEMRKKEKEEKAKEKEKVCMNRLSFSSASAFVRLSDRCSGILCGI